MRPLFYERRSEDVFMGKICETPYPMHVHDVAEIVCITQGQITMTIAGKTRTILPGDIAIAFPNAAHSYDAVSGDAAGVAMIFSPDVISEFTHAFRCKSIEEPLLKSSDKAPMLDSLICSMQALNPQENSALKLGYLHLFLSYLFSCISLQLMDKPMQSGLSVQVLQYISDHFTEPLSLESTAHALGISRIHLSHIFSQQLRINFRQYINSLRIDRAYSLLREPAYTISEVSYLCGYGNPRTFHRAFYQLTGKTPGEYREQMSNNRRKS